MCRLAKRTISWWKTIRCGAVQLDGWGYPAGLSDNQIMLEARISAVADTVEAMASNRPCIPPAGLHKALEVLSENSGTLYDPRVVDACLKLFSGKEFEFK